MQIDLQMHVYIGSRSIIVLQKAQPSKQRPNPFLNTLYMIFTVGPPFLQVRVPVTPKYPNLV